MTDLIEKLTEMAARADDADALYIRMAIDRIEKLEAELHGYREDITDWRDAVEKQMRRKRDIKRKKLWER